MKPCGEAYRSNREATGARRAGTPRERVDEGGTVDATPCHECHKP